MEISSGVAIDRGPFLTFINNTSKKFSVNIEEVNKMVSVLFDRNDDIAQAIISHEKYENHGSPWKYQEKPYRSLADSFFPLIEFPTINPLIGSQTNGIYSAVNSYVCHLLTKSVDTDRYEFDRNSIQKASELIRSGHKAENIGTLLSKNIAGPFDSAKTAALGALSFLYNSQKESFIKNIEIESEKARVDSIGVYLWATRTAINAGADNRVFNDDPFEFNGANYYLSDQWIYNSGNGRSIIDLNKFLAGFFCEITQHAGKYYLVKRQPFTGPVLPKPFLLLAGISGTGKTRFVREQAGASAALYGQPERSNYCLVPVRPDWHEPSDLLGYISRIGNDGTRYVVTDLLRFIVKAWKHAAQSATAEKIECKSVEAVCPFWLCLDEMNLAPVEQYFADYLSILETRKWESGVYSCDPILKSDTIDQLKADGIAALWKDLELTEENPVNQGLKEYFSKGGIPLPPNLIVAGTVNMDETTHGFSRKVIDRALTLDFGEFYPNDYAEFFEPAIRPKTLGFPILKQIVKADLASVAADPDGTKTRDFLDGVNAKLKGTPFELAYRALNEALLAVVCFNPKDDRALQAVWDDFLMMKVLPRIEGDAEKLGFDGEQTGLLNDLSTALKVLLPVVAGKERPDLFREKAADGGEVTTGCRSLDKLGQMQKRLEKNSFTSFWP